MELLPEFREQAKKSNPPEDDAAAGGESTHSEETRLLLQGQLRYLEDWDAMIFLCNPLSVLHKQIPSSCSLYIIKL